MLIQWLASSRRDSLAKVCVVVVVVVGQSRCVRPIQQHTLCLVSRSLKSFRVHLSAWYDDPFRVGGTPFPASLLCVITYHAQAVLSYADGSSAVVTKQCERNSNCPLEVVR
jgi:hypothetical protein